MSKIVFYTDGSCSPNPGPGGFAVIRDGVPVGLGHDKNSTNIRMEGRALLRAIELGQETHALYVIQTDSQFWIDVLTKWAPNWQKNNWKKKTGPIQNLELVQELYAAYIVSAATLQWIKAHEGHKGNELADEWANKARLERLVK
jgi:ribonuclease HI